MQFEYLTIIFPLATALFALFWFIRWARIHRGPLPDAGPGAAALPLSPGFTRGDWIVLGVLTLVYAVTAFSGLGTTRTPVTFLHYTEGNQYALIELREPTEVTAIRYYTGLNTADYRLEFSMDGENWTEQTAEDGTSGMTQQYSQLFRWCDATVTWEGPVKYIRVISGAEQYLGEIALYGADGALLTTADFTVASGCEALADEQDTIPAEGYTYLNGTYFDEIYHPRTAYEMILQIWPYEITHPPLGKAIISLGIRMFGMTPFGWRFMGTLFGVLMLPPLYVLLKRMTSLTVAAAAGTTVFAFDFMHYVQTRLATIDTYAVFFTLLMYLFMYLWLKEPEPQQGPARRRLLWLGLAGLSFGLGAASKWVCFYAGAGLAVLWLVYWGRRCVREEREALVPLGRNVLWCLLFFVLVPAVIYYVSYWSYAPSQGIDGPWRLFRREYLQLVLDNQKYMYSYHAGLDATHPYASKWFQWLLDVRPILYYLESFPEENARSSFAAFSNPLVCWGGLLAMVGMGYMAVKDRDETALFILVGYLANLLPWVLVSRLTFAYHYFPCTVFLVLALGHIFADLVRRDRKWRVSVGCFVGVSVGLFVLFWPVLSGAKVNLNYTRYVLKWFSDTWPF